MAFWTRKTEKTKEFEELSNTLINLANKVALLKADITGLEMEVNKIKHAKIRKLEEKDLNFPVAPESLNTLNPFKI